MKRDAEGGRLWFIVAATVRPFPGRSVKPLPVLDGEGRPEAGTGRSASSGNSGTVPHVPTSPTFGRSAVPVTGREDLSAIRPPDPIEPNRLQRLARGRAPVAPIIDLHGLDQDRARAALTAFVLRAHAQGERTVMVITGKGALGDGVLRRRTPEWLAEAPLRATVAGVSEAHRRHGGEGALYVALKRRGR